MAFASFAAAPVMAAPPAAPTFPDIVASDPIMAAAMLVGLFVASFLLGSIPWGVVISKAFFKKDIRSEGSGNIGATNAARTLGKKGAASVFLLDFGKGLLSGWLALECSLHLGAWQSSFGPIAMSLAFIGVVWGHIFSPWLHFKGGKGISAAVGCVFFVFGWVWALAELALFIAVVAVTRHVSAGSIAAAVACPLIALYLYWGHWFAWILITIAACTVIWAHRGNIKRLVEGTESRIGGKK